MKQDILHLLPDVERYYKANLHTHTDISDGRFTPEEIKAMYREKGYNIIAFTDHEVCINHSDLNETDFLALTGYEMAINVSCPNDVDSKTYHLCLLSKDPENTAHVLYDPKYMIVGNCGKYAEGLNIYSEGERKFSLECANEAIRQAGEAGYFVTYNHPNWSLNVREDYMGLRGIWGVEVHNNACKVLGYEDMNPHVFEELLRGGVMVNPVCADDIHRAEQAFGGWVMIGAKSLAYGDVVEAMERGDLYASTGAEIRSLTLQNGILKIICSPAEQVMVSSARRRAFVQRAETAEGLTEAEIDLHNWYADPMEGVTENTYFRVTVLGIDGKRAYTRAFTREKVAEYFE